METEQELLDAIRGGEREAKRRLYERYKGLAMAIVQRYIADYEDVRDVVQDAFVKILTSLNRFSYKGEGSLKAWVSSIVVHQAIDYAKSHERFLFTDQLPDEPEEEEPDVGRVPLEVLNKMIGQLPPGYRLVLNLHVFDQLSHPEIAHLLGIMPGTSSSQYAGAQKELAKRINNYLKNNKL